MRPGQETRSGTLHVQDVDGAWAESVFRFAERRAAPALPRFDLFVEAGETVDPAWSRGAKAEDDRAARADAAAGWATVASDEVEYARWRDVPRALWHLLRWSFGAAADAMPKLSDGAARPVREGWRLEGVTLFEAEFGFEPSTAGIVSRFFVPDEPLTPERMRAAGYRDEGI